MDFKEKIVLITGSSRGLGKVLGYEFARKGAKVVINYNNNYDEALLLKEKIESDFNSEVVLIKADVSKEEEVLEMVNKIVLMWGRIDILVNNAGISNDSLFDEKSSKDFNYYPESAEYDASKAGVISLTHNMAKFYAPYINVNCVCPGWIETDMNKGLSKKQKEILSKKILLKRFASPKEISNVVLFLASDFANYVNDSIIVVNGGYNNE